MAILYIVAILIYPIVRGFCLLTRRIYFGKPTQTKYRDEVSTTNRYEPPTQTALTTSKACYSTEVDRKEDSPDEDTTHMFDTDGISFLIDNYAT